MAVGATFHFSVRLRAALLAGSDVEQGSQEPRVYQMQIWCVQAAVVGSGHQCLCVVLIKIEIYALPAFMSLGRCGNAYLDLPPLLSRQAGRVADIINYSLSFDPTFSTLPPSTTITATVTLVERNDMKRMKLKVLGFGVKTN